MLRSILIALDSVTPDGAALFSACDLAEQFGARLRVAMCPDRRDIRGGEAHGIGGASLAEHRDTVLTQRLEERLQAERSGLADRLSQAGIAPEIVEYQGAPADVLQAASEMVDLVVLPHGRPQTKARDDIDTGFALPVEDVLHRIVRPVLLVADSTIGPGPVVVAYDGSESAQRVLQTGLWSGLFGQREVIILSFGYGVAAAEAMAAPAATLVAAHGHKVRVEAVAAQGEAAGEIAAILPSLEPGLFVSGCFGAQGVLEWLFGGTTEHLLPAIDVPWLVQR
ncbi:universal stress protein [Geminicoccus roseus]|uniref:universal stress protein n=1 Tax=Geminicoccus roseus TaxID=404900 RepID=UPI000412C600|nr:universal stress protein [Geminicoccus roseus]